ncbi:MAG: endolytic transglycosylase MltG [Candidatus Kuenenbacteria bacterium]
MQKNRVVSMRKSGDNGQSASSRIFGALIVFLIVAGLLLSAWFVFAISVPAKLDGGVSFNITKGEGVNKISYNLKNQKIIKNSFAFEIYAYLKDVGHHFQAGSYELPEIINIKRLVEILTMGQNADEWTLTVIEGWTAREISQRLENDGKFQSEELLEAIGYIPGDRIDFKQNYDFLNDKPDSASLEGYLFPDTYRFFIESGMKDILNKMLDNFDKKLTQQMRADIQAKDKTIFDIIRMASIIEREVRTEEDRPIVAGIFWKRLDAGMALEADSTVNYITGKNTPAVSLEDLQIDSPYNTYKYPGLPPGPISNPGLASIEAAIYPEESDYWFFLTDSEGMVHYAENFDEHVENKRKYLR